MAPNIGTNMYENHPKQARNRGYLPPSWFQGTIEWEEAIGEMSQEKSKDKGIQKTSAPIKSHRVNTNATKKRGLTSTTNKNIQCCNGSWANWWWALQKGTTSNKDKSSHHVPEKRCDILIFSLKWCNRIKEPSLLFDTGLIQGDNCRRT